MPIPSSLLGRSTEPIHQSIDARWLMAFAAGIDDQSAAFLDTRRGIVGHPLFPVCVEWPAVLAAGALAPPEVLTRGERLRGVHATHDLVIHRPVLARDELTTVATVASIERRTPGAFEVLRLDTVDAQGSPVATTLMGSLFLGVDIDGELEPPTAVPDPVDRAAERSRPPGPRLATSVRSIPATAAHVYTECSRIWNPIHTDRRAAEQAGLERPILHGTATLAMAVSEIVAVVADGDASLVRRVSCRFGALVTMPSTIRIRLFRRFQPHGGPSGSAVTFDVVNEAGERAIRDGVVVLGPHAS